MRVREAMEADADRLSTLAGDPRDVMLNLIHDRTVRVAEPERSDAGDADDPDGEAGGDGSGGETGGSDSDDGPDPLGFVSFDARDGVVHVTRIEGEEDALDCLLEEPIGFARNEGMAVEALVTGDREELLSAAKGAGFVPAGDGPTFEGERTTKYRLEPE